LWLLLASALLVYFKKRYGGKGNAENKISNVAIMLLLSIAHVGKLGFKQRFCANNAHLL
jgi:hypothetical protein